MLWFSLAPDATAAKAMSPRVAGITINDATFETIAQTDAVAVLRGVLDRCVVAAEQRFHARFGCDNDTPAALVKIDIKFQPDLSGANTSILGPLATYYPVLVRSLRVLTIECNDYDESAALGAFAALATHLRELGGLMTLRGLASRCEYLRKVSLRGCRSLSSLDGLEDRAFLEEVIVSSTGITVIAPLRTCPALTKVDLGDCEELSSIEGLEGHQRLQVVYASWTAITSIEPLRTCPALTEVDLFHCRLSSIEALEDHQFLQVLDASSTAITSIDSLRSCPALTKLYLGGCHQLPADVSLPTNVKIIR